jgi:predicted nucleotidyltransferase component of viral defense system
LQKFDIKEWVNQDSDYAVFRQAVHIILTAIAATPFLQASMIMKGGILLALSYSSSRYTKDIDFSSSIKRPDFDLEDFRRQLEDSLINSVESLGYGLDCRVQRCTQNPKSDDATFPTIQVSIGYAAKGSPAHKRLLAGGATDVVQIDYSLNEPVEETELFELENGKVIHTYSLVEMVSEKFRALLQQEQRKRFRRQDIYDLHYVLSNHPDCEDTHTHARILERLVEKCRIRELQVDQEAMSKPEIRRRSETDYSKLEAEIDGKLPPFDEVYDLVESYYRSLPW